MRNAQHLFGQQDSILTGVTFLLLPSISAAVVGSLVFGYPVMMFMNGQPREAVRALIMTIGWLAAEMVGVMVIAIIRSR